MGNLSHQIDAFAPTVLLNNGEPIPIVGLGTYMSKPGEVKQAVLDAIDAGYRHIDGAHLYQNEAEVGEAVNAKIAEGVIKRSDMFLTSKLWCHSRQPDQVRAALLKTLNHLNTPYLDLYLIHNPVAFKTSDSLFPLRDDGKLDIDDDVDYIDTWRELERAVDDGLVRSIGISNFNKAQTERVLSVARIRPAVNQIELHPYLAQQKLAAYLRGQGIVVTGFGPLGSPERPSATSDDPSLMDNPALHELAARYKKTPAQILIRYQIERGLVVIPKSVTKSRIRSNFDVFDFALSAEDLAVLNGLDRNHRFYEFARYVDSKNYPFAAEY